MVTATAPSCTGRTVKVETGGARLSERSSGMACTVTAAAWVPGGMTTFTVVVTAGGGVVIPQ